MPRTEGSAPPHPAALAAERLYRACGLPPPEAVLAGDAPDFVRLLAAVGARNVTALAFLLGLGSLAPGGLALLARASGERDASIQALLVALGAIALLTAFGPAEGSEPPQARIRADRAAALLLVGAVAVAVAAVAGSAFAGVVAFACLASAFGVARALLLANGGLPGRLGLAQAHGLGLGDLLGRPIDDRLARALEGALAGQAAPPAPPPLEAPGWARLEELGRRRLDWAQREHAIVLGRLLPPHRRRALEAARRLAAPPPAMAAALALDSSCEAAALFERVAVLLVPGAVPARPAPGGWRRWWRPARPPYAEALRLLGASPAAHALIAFAPWRGLADRLLARLVAEDPDPGLRLEAIEAIGPERFFKALGTKPLDRGPMGALYVTRSPMAPTALVRVEDVVRGSNGRPHVHWLPVPPHVATAHEAVAWTFGKSERDYRPMIET